jgi:IMP dehydrogenase
VRRRRRHAGAALAAPPTPRRWLPLGARGPPPAAPRGERIALGTQASLEEILFGPGRQADGATNVIGALKRAMATTGYSDVKEFQRVEVVVSPYLGN